MTKGNSSTRHGLKPAPRRSGGNVKPAGTLHARGLKARQRLKAAAREVLNETGYHRLRVQDVTERAGSASGLFYRYFHDLHEIVAEISRDFFDELVDASSSLEVSEEPYDWIFENHLLVVERFARNPGILACLFGLAGDYEEFDEIWKRNAHEWNLQVAGVLERNAGLDRKRAEHMAFVLGAMTEGVIYQELIRQTKDLIAFGNEPAQIAETIAVMWYRAIFLKEPPVERLGRAGRHLSGVESGG